MNFQMFKLILEKAEEPEIKLPTSTGSSKKQESSRKTPTFALLIRPKPMTVWITTNCGKFLKKMGIPDNLTYFLRNLYAGQEATVRTGHETTDLLSKSGKEDVKAVYCHRAYLTYMQSTSRKMLGWMKHKLESRLPGEIPITRYTDDTTLMAESKEELKWLLMKVKEESEKVGFKTQHSENEDHGIWSHHFMGNRWETVETVSTVSDFILGAPKSLQMVSAAMKLKDAYSLEEKL